VISRPQVANRPGTQHTGRVDHGQPSVKSITEWFTERVPPPAKSQPCGGGAPPESPTGRGGSGRSRLQDVQYTVRRLVFVCSSICLTRKGGVPVSSCPPHLNSPRHLFTLALVPVVSRKALFG